MMKLNMHRWALAALILLAGLGTATAQNPDRNYFEQLYNELPTPNVYRNAAGAPGHQYYQNQADYEIAVRLDDAKQTIHGEETVTYHNNSPDALEYLWVQLDQNMRALDSDSKKIRTEKMEERLDFGTLKNMHFEFDGGFKLEEVKDMKGRDLPIQINKTMMRIHLDQPLKPGEKYSFRVKWWYNINDRMKIGGRSGYEHFEEEDNYLYTIAQFFPRMAVYNDIEGWQNKQFHGRGEFTLPFGDYKVRITVPSDHVVGATGVLQNSKEVLTSEQIKRLDKARNSYTEPVMIVTEEEARKAEQGRAEGSKTWVFHAENVRDFAFASSRKFIWDAMAAKVGNKTTLAMSYYPKEGNPLWERYSTKVVAHTVKTYSKYTIDYPYPVAISVHTKWIGMEYPMICFNGGRPEADGTYDERTKYGMISVIVHEVGHNFFPMIINSDERQWTWMDEGLNTFVQYLTEQEWDRDYPSRRGEPSKIVPYMRGDKSQIRPIMTNSENIFQFGNNAYGKPATALVILRETVLGRELFDYAFKMYCERWKFKHPSPADFFRTMEDASATDLDWFWRGWFFTNDHVDMKLDYVKWYRVNSQNPDVENAITRREQKEDAEYIGAMRDRESIPQSYIERDTSLQDFYNHWDPLAVSELDRSDYQKFISGLDEEDREILNSKWNYYEVGVSMVGQLPMPVILEFTFTDGTTHREHIPAYIWRYGAEQVTKVYFFEKEVASVALDPSLETADTDMSNNYWPSRVRPERFDLNPPRNWGGGENPMQRDQRDRQQGGN